MNEMNNKQVNNTIQCTHSQQLINLYCKQANETIKKTPERLFYQFFLKNMQM